MLIVVAKDLIGRAFGLTSNLAMSWPKCKTNYAKVAKESTKTLKLDPNYVRVFMRCAHAQEKFKNFEDAIKRMVQFLKNPTFCKIMEWNMMHKFFWFPTIHYRLKFKHESCVTLMPKTLVLIGDVGRYMCCAYHLLHFKITLYMPMLNFGCYLNAKLLNL